MASDPSALPHWRRFFGAAGVDIFEVINAAVAVAAVDRPSELKKRRDLIAQRLFAAGLPGTSHYGKEASAASVRMMEAAPLKGRRPVAVGKKDGRPMPTTSTGSTEKAPAPIKSQAVRKNADQIVPAAAKASSVRPRSATPPTTAAVREKAPAQSTQEQSMEAKLAIAKRKLHEGYQEFADAKRQRSIQVIEAPEMARQRRQRQHPIMRLRGEVRCAATTAERRALMSSLGACRF